MIGPWRSISSRSHPGAHISTSNDSSPGVPPQAACGLSFVFTTASGAVHRYGWN